MLSTCRGWLACIASGLPSSTRDVKVGWLLQMDLATKSLKTNNMKLKGLVTQVPLSAYVLFLG